MLVQAGEFDLERFDEIPMKKILVIDDDPTCLAATNQLLKGRYRLAFFNGGEDAPEVIQKVNPDLIVTDNLMEGMSGVDICRWVKAQEATRSIPVIVHSGCVGSKEQEDCLSAGADMFVSKNYNGQDLVSAIETLIG